MDKKDVQKGIRTQDAEEPIKGINKIYDSSDSLGGGTSSDKQLKSQSVQASKPSSIASLLMAAICVAVIIGIVMIWTQRQHGYEGVPGDGQGVQNVGSAASHEGIGITRASELVKLALLVSDVDGVKQYYDLGNAEAEEVLTFLSELALPDHSALDMQWVIFGFGARSYEGITIKWNKGHRLQARLAPLVRQSDDSWKVDYAAFACMCDPAWEKLIAGKYAQAKARVVFTEDTYYNDPFNEGEWQCYRLTSVASKEAVFGYARKNSAQAKALEEIVLKSFQVSGNQPDDAKAKEAKRRSILDLQRPNGARLNQFEIKRVLAVDWVEEEVPFDQQFEAASAD